MCDTCGRKGPQAVAVQQGQQAEAVCGLLRHGAHPATIHVRPLRQDSAGGKHHRVHKPRLREVRTRAAAWRVRREHCGGAGQQEHGPVRGVGQHEDWRAVCRRPRDSHSVGPVRAQRGRLCRQCGAWTRLRVEAQRAAGHGREAHAARAGLRVHTGRQRFRLAGGVRGAVVHGEAGARVCQGVHGERRVLLEHGPVPVQFAPLHHLFRGAVPRGAGVARQGFGRVHCRRGHGLHPQQLCVLPQRVDRQRHPRAQPGRLPDEVRLRVGRPRHVALHLRVHAQERRRQRGDKFQGDAGRLPRQRHKAAEREAGRDQRPRRVYRGRRRRRALHLQERRLVVACAPLCQQGADGVRRRFRVTGAQPKALGGIPGRRRGRFVAGGVLREAAPKAILELKATASPREAGSCAWSVIC